MGRRLRMSVCVIVCWACAPAFAQEPAPEEGLRIRVSMSSTLTEAEIVTVAGFSPSAAFDRGSKSVGVRSTEGAVAFVARPGRRLAGTITSRDANGFVLRSSEALVIVPRAGVAKVERRIGHRSRGRYAAFGALIGLGLGGAVGYMAGSSCTPKPGSWFGCFMQPAAGAFAGAIFGAGGGAITGALMPPADQWQTLPAPSWP